MIVTASPLITDLRRRVTEHGARLVEIRGEPDRTHRLQGWLIDRADRRDEVDLEPIGRRLAALQRQLDEVQAETNQTQAIIDQILPKEYRP